MSEATVIPRATAVEMASLYEGTSVQVQPAPLLKRALAFAIDVGVISAASYALLIAGVFAAAGTAGLGVFAKRWLGPEPKILAGISVGFLVALVVGVLAVMVLFDVYFVWFESRRGATPGKAILGLKVISLNGARLTTGQCILRELFRHIDCLLIFPGLISISLSKRRQRIGDLVASTIVVHSKRSEDTARYLYLSQEDYQWLVERLRPGEVPADMRDKYLAFAYPEFVLQSRKSSAEALAAWESEVRGLVPATTDQQIEQRSLLRFFAEVCFQQKNSENA